MKSKIEKYVNEHIDTISGLAGICDSYDNKIFSAETKSALKVKVSCFNGAGYSMETSAVFAEEVEEVLELLQRIIKKWR